MEAVNFATELLVRLPIWALFASPLIAALVFVARKLHRRSVKSKLVRVLFAVFAGVLLAPMPLSMFMVLAPNALVAFGGHNYYAATWDWALVSIPLTVLLSFGAVWRYLAPSNHSFKPTPLRGAA